jgi:hypothetical protein
MRMISRLTFTSSLPKGTWSDQLSFGASALKRASCFSQATKLRSASAGPARKRLIPSSASNTVPFRCRFAACERMLSRSASVSVKGTKR